MVMQINSVRESLKQTFKGLVPIQTAIANADGADLVVLAWSGVKLHVRLIDEPLKPRGLKRILQEATNVGTNTMFLLDTKFVADDGKRMNVPEWLHAFHALSPERVYCYRQGKAGLEIFQVHFEPTNTADQWQMWHGPNVPLERLRFHRVNVKSPRSLKGDWLVGDFGSHAFWKNTTYRNYRYRQDRNASRNRNTSWQDWSTYQTWSGTYDYQRSHNGNGNGRGIPTGPLQEHLDTCYRILGIQSATNQEDAKKAFRKLAIRFHPDTSDLPQAEAEEKFRAINAAYEYIKAAKGWN